MKAQCSPLYASALSLSRIKFSYLFFIILLFVFKFSILLCFLSWYQSYLFLGIYIVFSFMVSKQYKYFSTKTKNQFLLIIYCCWTCYFLRKQYTLFSIPQHKAKHALQDWVRWDIGLFGKLLPLPSIFS